MMAEFGGPVTWYLGIAVVVVLVLMLVLSRRRKG